MLPASFTKIVKNNWNQAWADLQAPQCLRCHSLNIFNMYLCKKCEHHIDTLYFDPQIQNLENEIVVQSIYQWTPNESDALSEIAILLKSQDSKWTWFQIAKKMKRFWDIKPSCFVPIPGHCSSRLHSTYFSEALSDHSNGSHLKIIRSITRLNPQSLGEPSNANSRVKQQRLSRAERQRSNIQIHVDFTELNQLPLNSKITLVDDIVTTGFTILKTAAIIRDLRPDLRMESVVLFNRTRSSEESDRL